MKSQDTELDRDPFLCTCAPCKRFWEASFQRSASLLAKPPASRSADTSTMYPSTRAREDHPAVLKVGDRVSVRGLHKGVVKYVGVLDDNLVAPDLYVGIHLDENIGSVHNGIYNGKRFFHCPRGHGMMVRYADVRLLTQAEKRPPIYGNPMFPSYEEIKKRRRIRSARAPHLDLGPPYSIHKKSSESLPQLYKGTTGLTRPQRIPRTVIFDSNDMAVKDAQRRDVEERRRQAVVAHQSSQAATMNKSVNKWREQFGGGSRAEHMIRTLRKLHIAYRKGVELVERQEAGGYSDDGDQDSGDEERPGQLKDKGSRGEE